MVLWMPQKRRPTGKRKQYPAEFGPAFLQHQLAMRLCGEFRFLLPVFESEGSLLRSSLAEDRVNSKRIIQTIPERNTHDIECFAKVPARARGRLRCIVHARWQRSGPGPEA